MGAEQSIIFSGKEYTFERVLGRGAFGVVYLAKERSTEKEFAIKVIKKSKFKNPEYANREFESLKSLDHKNIIKLYGARETEDKLYLLLEYISGGTLSQHLKRSITEEQAKDVFRQIITGVNYLHSKAIAHRDLKPANILMNKNGTVKIADFGLAKQIKEEVYKASVCPPALCKTQLGTKGYCAPEVFNKDRRPYDGFKADMYSLGIILRKDIATKLNAGIPSDCKVLADKLTSKDPSVRPLIGDVLKDKWLVNYDSSSDSSCCLI